MHYSYRSLLKALQGLTEEQLDMDVTVFDGNIGEYLPASELEIVESESDQLDQNHPYLPIN